ncbi:MAG TPA: thioesterase family protein [Prolixibacteraceae bacterium]|nr:thioesterase family protein [Prolixibacteraceae bacterium]
MSFNHSFPIQIRFNDADIAGHIYNGTYQDYFDTARLDYFKKVLGENINWRKTGLVIVSVRNDFSAPVFLNDQIEIQSKVCVLGKKSLQMIQQVTKIGESEPVATGKTVLVCYDLKKKESVLIPQKWRKKLVAFEPGLIGD